MRIGANPEKKKGIRLHYKKHRVIIPVYIPDVEDAYFMNLFNVFKISMESLLETISTETLVTIINNDCKNEVSDYINKLLDEKKIDKHIKLAKNYGKVYTAVAEARASYEDYITIADADVFYFSNWENEVFKIFNTFKYAGVVAPLPAPHGALYNNVSLFGKVYNQAKMGNVVDPKSFELFEKGTNNPNIFQDRKHKWKEKQYYLEKSGIKACVGSGHFVATYKNVFKSFPDLKPEHVFRVGDVELFLDVQFDKLGYYRLSSLKANVYHLGNTIPDWIKKINIKQKEISILIQKPIKLPSQFKGKYYFKKLLFKFLKKYKLI